MYVWPRFLTMTSSRKTIAIFNALNRNICPISYNGNQFNFAQYFFQYYIIYNMYDIHVYFSIINVSIHVLNKVNILSIYIYSQTCLRDRPFNLKGGGYGFLFRSEFFFRTIQELEYFFLLLHEARIFFPEFNVTVFRVA